MKVLAWDPAWNVGKHRGKWCQFKQYKDYIKDWKERHGEEYTVTTLGNKLYIIGGKVEIKEQDCFCDDEYDIRVETSDKVDVLDLVTGRVYASEPLCTQRYGHTCTAVKGKLYVAGGNATEYYQDQGEGEEDTWQVHT